MSPISLYIHVPWCIRKCPYCDFNSHKSPQTLPEQDYIKALIEDLNQDLQRFDNRPVSSIFIGGGTPSLLSPDAYAELFDGLKKTLKLNPDIEITLEANPGTVEQERFRAYRQLGINRLSLGIQSFNPKHLERLGRIHDDTQAHKAIEAARNAGFTRLNLDLMHGLPNQSVEQGLNDLKTAVEYQPEHLSWYQLTIEPNTVFYKEKPPLPSEDEAFELEGQGLALLSLEGYQRYEISAFCKSGEESRHNLNYWLFGDYYGIGAGAHGKVSTTEGVFRTHKQRQPKEYLNPEKAFLAGFEQVQPEELLFEFMLNTTRLERPIQLELFQKTTGLDTQILMRELLRAQEKKLILIQDQFWRVTELGRRFTNDLQAMFLPS